MIRQTAQSDAEEAGAAVLRARYDTVVRAMTVLATLSYGVYLLLFLALGVPWMPVFNAVATVVCLAALAVLHSGRAGVASALAASAVLGHIIPATALLGWRASFHLFGFVVLVFLLLHPERRRGVKIFVAASITAAYVLLEAQTLDLAPVVDAQTQLVFRVVNTVVFSGTLAFLALLYSQTIWDATRNLVFVNRRLERAERSVRDSERTLRTLLDAAPTPLVVTGLQDGVIRYANERAAELFELSLPTLVGKCAPDFYVRPDDRKSFIEMLRRDGVVPAFTAQLRSSSGREQWMLLSAETIHLNDEELFMVGFANVDEHKAVEAKLRHLATTDALTGAFNRRHFLEVSDIEVARAARSRRPVAVAMIDADHFKRVNDQLGHDAGDAALRMIAQTLQDRARASDVVARLGGEEFALLLPETSLEDARTVVERMRVSIAERGFQVDGVMHRLTVSIGLAIVDPGETMAGALRRADEALYAAKRGGRDRVVVAEGGGAGATEAPPTPLLGKRSTGSLPLETIH